MRRATVRKSRALLLALVLMVERGARALASAAPGKVNLNWSALRRRCSGRWPR